MHRSGGGAGQQRSAHHQWDIGLPVHSGADARQPAVLNELQPDAKLGGNLGDELRLPGQEIRKPHCDAAAAAPRLESHLRLHSGSERKLRVQLLHCPERGARSKIQL